MIKKLFVLALISVVSVSAMACSKEVKKDHSAETEMTEEDSEKAKPNLNLVYQQDGKEVTSTAGRGGYSYTIDNGDGTKTSEIADASHILQWTEELMPVVVMDKNSQTVKIILQFNKKATNCKIIAWEEKYFNNDTGVQESDGKEVNIQFGKDGEDSFVEVSPGYIYEVKAEGEEWRADFGFHVVTATQTSAVGEFHTRSFADIQNILDSYPDTLDELNKNKDVFIVVHGNVKKGKELWESFYQKVQDKEPAELTMAQLTIEGDPILYYLTYDGEKIYVVEDVSRDAFKGDYADYVEYTYSYIKEFEDSTEDSKGKYIILLNDDSLTLENIRNIWNSENDEVMKEIRDLIYINSEKNRLS
ncbi:MAG TPA: hypothetical protein DCE48_08435 [Lachnospiraceae bacterium]|uniref:DUF4362 domain-containing protein n=1 Tax=Anaerosporobacter sp. TaxID=1872529 RepID=UPI000EBEB632|nr:DUF4362 domain-containing protein [Anaerosporobacter sp.]HAB60713.1 hypothetical protein [Lachnospiraceae bacterium]